MKRPSEALSQVVILSPNRKYLLLLLLHIFFLVPTICRASTVATPTLSPATGTYTSIQTVTISDSTSGATIYYTTDGTTPTTSSSVYSGSISVSSSETINAIAAETGYANSAVGSAAYTIGSITLVQHQVFTNLNCTPTCPTQAVTSTGSGNLLFVAVTNTGTSSPAYISSISCSPGCGSWTLPGSACQQAGSDTGGIDCGYVLSSAAGATSVTITMSASSSSQEMFFREYHTSIGTGFHFDSLSSTVNSSCTSCATPSLSPLIGTNDLLIAGGSPGHVFTGMNAPYGDVDIDTGAATVIGDLLDSSSGTGATITQNISNPAALYTIAFTDSNIAPAAAPTFSPNAGTYTSAQTVTISDATPGAAIYYTTNGLTPTTSSTQYTGPITVSSSETVEAFAKATGYSQSSIGSAVYIIGAPQTPTFVQGNTTGVTSLSSTASYTSNVTAGDALYCISFDGSGANHSNGCADSQGNSWSSVASVSLGTDHDTVTLACTTAGVSGPNTVTFNVNGIASAVVGGIYQVHNSTCILDGAPATSNTTNASACNSGPLTTSTVNDLLVAACGSGGTPLEPGSGWSDGLSMGVGGSVILLGELQAASIAGSYTATSSAFSTGTEQATLQAAFLPTYGASFAATPSFSPAGGTYSSAQTVMISDGTSGATIYYTTDGTAPTTSSSVYSGPITVSSSETVEAIATDTGYSQSAVGSAAYTITPGGTQTTSVSYAYDSLGRLYQAQYITPNGTITVTYSYDSAGNRTSVVTQ